MEVTTAQDVFLDFMSLIQHKKVLPDSLLIQWLKKANSEFSQKATPLNFDKEILSYDMKLDDYYISILAMIMKRYYLERELSRVNKITKIVGKDISIDGNDGTKKYTAMELETVTKDIDSMFSNIKPTAYL